MRDVMNPNKEGGWREGKKSAMARINSVLGGGFRDLDEAMERVFGGLDGLDDRSDASMPCEVRETTERYVLVFDVPGVQKSDIELDVMGSRLIVSASRRAACDDEQILMSEMTYGTFHRTFTLPDDVDVDTLAATFENGVLEVIVRKAGRPRAGS